MGFNQDHDLAPRVRVIYGADTTTLTAGGAGDATEVVGQGFDRFANDGTLTAVLALRYKAALAATKTLSFAYTVESADDANFTNPVPLVTQASTLQETGAVGGSTNRGVLEIGLDLAGAKQFVRARFTPDLNAANTDTAEVSAVFVLGGSRNLPF